MEGRLLIVEDDPRVLGLLKDLLEHDGYTVTTATDGEEGLRTFKPGEFDVIVTDVKMPNMDGVSMMKAIRALDATVEVVVLTGFGTLEMTIDVLRAGGYDFLKKPEEIPQRIRPTVQRALEKRQLGLQNQLLMKQLEETNVGLETRVGEQTAELTDANQQLEDTLLMLAEINQTLRESSFIDEDTGLFNRQYFEQHIIEDVVRAKRYHWNFALAVFEFAYAEPSADTPNEIDIDTLRWIADAIKSRLREGDLLARYDDDRFVLMLPQATEEATGLCDEINGLAANPPESAQIPHRIKSQYGVVNCPEDSRSAEMLLVALERSIETG
ncbi:MAG: response regulator [Candidatus Latescibacteria bacterium]|nr:response regulator [Candidatus Latescibacterota bacterium]